MVYYLKYNLVVSRFTMGMYKISQKSPKSIRLFNKFLRILCNLCLLSGLILSIVNIIKRGITEIDKIAMEIMTAVIFFTALFRTNYFYLRDEKLQEVVTTINKIFKDETSTGLDEKTLIKYDKITKIFVVLWGFSCLFTGQFMAFLPLTVIGKVGRVLPLPLWYPYDWKESPYYELTYFTQALTQFFMTFSYGNSDMFYSCTTIILTGQFNLFDWELQNVIYTVLLKQGISKSKVLEFRNYCTGNFEELTPENNLENFQISPEINKTFSSEKFKRDLNNAFINCVKHHQRLLDVCKLVQEFYSPLLLPEILLGIFYGIFMMYGIVVSQDVSVKMTLMEYFAMSNAQIFCVTYLGQKVFDESEILLDNLYKMPWYLCDKSFRKMFNILQTNLIRPITITAWKFFDMKLTTFVFAVKTSFSFLAFLRQVTEEKAE